MQDPCAGCPCAQATPTCDYRCLAASTILLEDKFEAVNSTLAACGRHVLAWSHHLRREIAAAITALYVLCSVAQVESNGAMLPATAKLEALYMMEFASKGKETSRPSSSATLHVRSHRRVIPKLLSPTSISQTCAWDIRPLRHW